MIYIFAFGDSWVKVGYTDVGPYERRRLGFWHNVHPTALCHRLDECELVALFAGDEPTENAIHAALLPFAGDARPRRSLRRRSTRRSFGEFYPASRLDVIQGIMRCMLKPLSLPEDPGLRPRPPRKRTCCGGNHNGFERADHAARSYATKGIKAPCVRCGREVSIRRDKLKKHQRSAICKPLAPFGSEG